MLMIMGVIALFTGLVLAVFACKDRLQFAFTAQTYIAASGRHPSVSQTYSDPDSENSKRCL